MICLPFKSCFIIWASYFLSVFVQLKSECIGVSYDRAETMECKVNNVARDCGARFPVGTSLSYKCHENYIPGGAWSEDDTDTWKFATCQGDSTWSGGLELTELNCVIDYGKFRDNAVGVLLILGGQRLNSYEFPWHAAIFMEKKYICGGTLISTDFILTAAHCTYRSDDVAEDPFLPFDLEVVLAPISGVYDDNNNPTVQKLLVSQIVRYNEGNKFEGRKTNYKYDLALLKLIYPAQLNKYVRPARLPYRNDIASETMLMQVNGYGTTSADSSRAQPARQFYGTNVTTNSPECLSDPFVTSTTDLELQFCTTPTDPANGICIGDSGGGSFRREPNDHWSIQGIISYGSSRALASSSSPVCFYRVIFTRVRYFLLWIYKNIAPQSTRGIENTIPSTTKSPIPYYAQPDGAPGDMVNQISLALHNDYRRRHGSPPLQIDYKLVAEAQQHANYIVSNNFQLHSKYDSPYGQNMYEVLGVSYPSDEVARKAVTTWYDGISGYSWSSPSRSFARGFSFSQIVWRSSLLLGVGLASRNDRSVVIAFYSPAGNIADLQRYKDNVLPPQ